ncbi:BLUF domain-containing protein [Phenylobacterium kunshanense]|uniref:BLUF domain-containing protein n=1 Tax=Phenylobacterium kunshanense TaxID=1445034 RepID=UPI001402EC62
MARLSREELAILAGVSLDTVKRLEKSRGPVRAHADTIARIISAFAVRGVSLRYDDDCSELVALHDSGFGPARNRGVEQEGVDVHCVVYISQCDAAEGEVDGLLDAIRVAASRRNPRLAVTGALWFQDGYFLQALEGPKSSLEALYGLIALDARHRRPAVLQHGAVEQRTFPQWLLCRRHRADGLIGVPSLSPAIAPGAALVLLRTLVEGESKWTDSR